MEAGLEDRARHVIAAFRPLNRALDIRATHAFALGVNSAEGAEDYGANYDHANGSPETRWELPPL